MILVELSDEQIEHIACGSAEGLIDPGIESMCDEALTTQGVYSHIHRDYLLSMAENDDDTREWVEYGRINGYKRRPEEKR